MKTSPAKAPVHRRYPTLWAALAVLAVVALSLGAALIRIQNQTVEPRAFLVAPEAAVPGAAATSSAPSTPSPTAPATGASAPASPGQPSPAPRVLHPPSPEPAVARPAE